MKVVKMSRHHIRFDTGDAIKISPASFVFEPVEELFEAEFKPELAFTEIPGGFRFGNLPGNLHDVPVKREGVSTQAAIYYQKRNVLELGM